MYLKLHLQLNTVNLLCPACPSPPPPPCICLWKENEINYQLTNIEPGKCASFIAKECHALCPVTRTYFTSAFIDRPNLFIWNYSTIKYCINTLSVPKKCNVIGINQTYKIKLPSQALNFYVFTYMMWKIKQNFQSYWAKIEKKA